MPRHFNNWLKAYADFTELSEAPKEFHFWVGVSTIAGAMRRQVWIDQRHFQWTPNFYIILVGPAGIVTKSTTMRAGMGLLRKIDGVHMGPQSMTWQALTVALENAREDIPIGEDWIPMSPITCDVSELGTFLRTDDREMVDVLTDLWDGQLTEWVRTTKTQGDTSLINPWINVVGCTTPTWLRANFTTDMIGGGLASRCVFVFGDHKRHLIPYPGDRIESHEHQLLSAKLVEDLKEIAKMRGEIHLTDEAKTWGAQWYKQHWSVRPKHMASERFSGYIARKQTHMHKLAIILSAAENNQLRITLENLQLAERMMIDVEKNMQKVFEMIGSVASNQHIHELISFLKVYKKMSRKELWKLCVRIMTQKEFGEAIDGATSAQYMKVLNEPGGPFFQIMKEGREI